MLVLLAALGDKGWKALSEQKGSLAVGSASSVQLPSWVARPPTTPAPALPQCSWHLYLPLQFRKRRRQESAWPIAVAGRIARGSGSTLRARAR